MHIEFTLPNGAGGIAAGYRAMHLTRQIQAWATLHNVEVKKYNSQAYRLCFEFGRLADYTLFALCWDATSIWNKYTVINT